VSSSGNRATEHILHTFRNRAHPNRSRALLHTQHPNCQGLMAPKTIAAPLAVHYQSRCLISCRLVSRQRLKWTSVRQSLVTQY
jgi:hypothetical protein